MMKKISLILLASAVAFGSAFADNFKYGNFGGSIEASKKAGYDGVQFWLGRKDQDDKGGYSKQSLENMKASLKKNGMLACGICVGCYHQFLFEEDKNVVEYMKNVVDNAAELGADNILIPFFGKSSLYKNGNELRYERLFPLVQKLKEIAPYAAKKGVNLALETTLLAKDEIRLLDMINEPNVKIYFDTLNTAWAGENPADALRLLGKDRRFTSRRIRNFSTKPKDPISTNASRRFSTSSTTAGLSTNRLIPPKRTRTTKSSSAT